MDTEHQAELSEIKKFAEHDKSLQLLLYRTMPAHQDAWFAGYSGANTGLDLADNPYIVDDEEYTIWEDGWWQGFYGEDYTAEVLCAKLSETRFAGNKSVNTSSLIIEKIKEKKYTKVSEDRYKNISLQSQEGFLKNKYTKIAIILSVIIASYAGMTVLLAD